jgi:transcriptional regulator GlxA family with amidase domain
VRISILLFKDCIAFPSISAMELLSKADEVRAGLTGDPGPFFEIELVAAGRGRTIRAAHGLPVRCHRSMRDDPDTDLVLVPAFDGDVEAQLEANRPAVDWIRRAHDAGAHVASICTGAFALAEAGLLDGREATTHWSAQGLFAARYPQVRLRPDGIIVDQGRVCTSGGATSYLNLLMFLVEKYCGVDVARFSAKMFLIDVHKGSQAAYAIFSSQKDHDDDAVLHAQELIEERRQEPLQVTELAREVAVSPRNFARRFKAATGNTPLEYIQRVRVEAAKRDLENTRRPVSEIGTRVGYEDVGSFRKVFSRVTGVSPVEYRRRYRPMQAQGQA